MGTITSNQTQTLSRASQPSFWPHWPTAGAKLATGTYSLNSTRRTDGGQLTDEVTTYIRLTSGGQSWEARTKLRVQWTFVGYGRPNPRGDYALYYTATVLEHTTGEIFSGTPPEILTAEVPSNPLLSLPAGSFLETLSGTAEISDIPGTGGSTNYTTRAYDYSVRGYYVAPPRLFLFGESVQVDYGYFINKITEGTASSDPAGGTQAYAFASLPLATINTTSDFGFGTGIAAYANEDGEAQLYSNLSQTGYYSTPGPSSPKLTGATLTGATWDFGDSTGTTETVPLSSAATPLRHTYEATGDYSAKLSVIDSWGNKSPLNTQLVRVASISTGRLVSLVCDPVSGFYVERRVTTVSGAKALITRRWNGKTWTQVHSTSTLQKPALGRAAGRGRLFSIAQNATTKTWILESSDDLGSTWEPMAQPFDSTFKAVSRPVFGQGKGLIVGLNASNILVAKTSKDGGKTWPTTVQSPGSGSKSFDIEYDELRGQVVLVADNISKFTKDFGATAWGSL